MDSGKRLQKVRKAMGFSSPEEVVDAFGWNIHTYKSHEAGRRGIPAHTAKKYAKVFKTTATYLLYGDEPKPKEADDSQDEPLRIVGIIKAGAFYEAEEFPDPHENFIDAAAIPAKYKGKNCFGLEVLGDSMNKVFPEGHILTVVPLFEYDDPIEDEDFVIVQRKDYRGTIEATAKQIKIIDGKAELVACSYNPKWDRPINIAWPYETPEECELETVEITGVIVWAGRPLGKL